MAEADYSAAIEVARRQRAPGLEVRASTGLAWLRRARGDFEAPDVLVAPLLGSYPPGVSTPDLGDARALLAA